MKKLNSVLHLNLKLILSFSFVLLLFLGSKSSFAQENPPIPIEVKVRTARFLNFGAFTLGSSGGTVVVDPNGKRTQTGDVILLNMGPTVSSAMYEVTANPGTLITITHPNNFILDGSSGNQIMLNNITYSVNNTFITTAPSSSINEIEVGGTLHVGNISGNRPGTYSGTITLTFIQQ